MCVRDTTALLEHVSVLCELYTVIALLEHVSDNGNSNCHHL